MPRSSLSRHVAAFLLAIGLLQSSAMARIYLADESRDQINIYPNTATGFNATPTVVISGNLTQLSQPLGVAVDANYIYVANWESAGSVIGNSVTIYPINASGNAAPVAEIIGSNTGLANCYGIAVDANYIYVANESAVDYPFGSICVFPKNANGNATPIAVIGGSDFQNAGFGYFNGIAVDATNIYLTSQGGDVVGVFPKTLNGNFTPGIILSNSASGLHGPIAVAVDSNYLYITNETAVSGLYQVVLYSLSGLSSGSTPAVTISGTNTLLEGPDGIAVTGTDIFVRNTLAETVTSYPVGSSGNTTPTTDLGGVGSGSLIEPGIFLAADTTSFTHFSVSFPTVVTKGKLYSMTVTALDDSGNTVTGYSGTVAYTSTDGAAVLPANSTLTNGVGVFEVTLNTDGIQTITATDTFLSYETGTSGNIKVGAAPVANPNLYWTDTSTGNRVIWVMSGTSYSSSVPLGNVATAWEIDGTGDFNTNGNTDILWTNTTTGERVIWLMSGNTFSSSVSLGVVGTNWVISGVGAFGGGNQPDILWTNTATGERVIWIMNGTAFSSVVSLGVVPAYWSIDGVADFNNDGQPDILFTNITTGQRLVWLMYGTSFGSAVSLGIVPAELRVSAVGNNGGGGVADIVMTNAETNERTVLGLLGASLVESNTLGTVTSNWELFQGGVEPVELAKYDFNGDGNPDILFENSSTGDLYAWLMNGTSLSSSVFIANVPAPWQVVGTGDFSADGSPDILWQNSSTGQVVIWVMDGTSYISTVPVAVAPAGWSVSAVADFNGDGSPDILWTNTTTGERLIWLMSGPNFVSSVSLGIVGTQWRIADAADFTGDGQPDIVFQNTSTGDCYVWLMNGTAFTTSVYIGNPGTQWQIAAAEPFDGVGQADIVFENTSTGDRYIWLMNGTTFESSVYLGNVATQWQIRN